MFNLSQLYAYLFPIPPPLYTALCFVQFLVLQAKHTSSFSQNPSRQGPSWLARHFCNNYPSALDLVLALALVALVLGVIYRGSIVLQLLNWSFDFWLELVIEFAKLISEALILFCKNDFISESTAQREGCCIVIY